MHPNTEDTAPERNERSAGPPHLIVAVIATTLSAAVVFFETAGVFVPPPLRASLLVITATAWMSYFVTRYDERVHRRLDRIEGNLDARLKQAGFAEGFVAGARRELPEPAVLRSVGGTG